MKSYKPRWPLTSQRWRSTFLIPRPPHRPGPSITPKGFKSDEQPVGIAYCTFNTGARLKPTRLEHELEARRGR